MEIRVFLADDHAIIRDGLRMMLDATPGFSVVGEASNGREAVRQVTQLKPDVVVMDITMPELNGTEATRQIRQDCPATQVVILSMHAHAEYVVRALEAGALGYLLKESAGREVLDAVRSVHALRRYTSQKIADTVIDDYMLQRAGKVARSPLELLSQREHEVLQLVVEGHSSAEIGRRLSLSPKTVETYRSRLMAKLNVGDVPGLVKFAIEHGLTSSQ